MAPKVTPAEIELLTQEDEDILAQMMEDEDDAPVMEMSAETRARMQSEVPPDSYFKHKIRKMRK
jgi:hypothetical protein